jgi:hypothetical protein
MYRYGPYGIELPTCLLTPYILRRNVNWQVELSTATDAPAVFPPSRLPLEIELELPANQKKQADPFVQELSL